MEDWVYIIEFLPEGRSDVSHYRREPVAYGIGDRFFTLLELSPKPGAQLSIGERVWIGKDIRKRDKIEKVKGRIGYDQLTGGAQSELPYVLEEIVKKNEEKFVNFFNDAPPISTRFHSLELLPGLGKKIMIQILNEKKAGKFKDFEDLKKRIPLLHSPEKIVAERILLELSDPHQKYRVFVR